MKKMLRKSLMRLGVAIVAMLVLPTTLSAQEYEISKQQFYEYLAAAKKGNAHAQYVIAECYRYGHSECMEGGGYYGPGAYKWYEKAAQQGHAAAQYEMGNFCFFYASDVGGTREEAVAAVQWWTKAAQKGFAAAQYCLGECYYTGTGVAKNYTKAVYWLREAARRSDERAIKLLKELGEVW